MIHTYDHLNDREILWENVLKDLRGTSALYVGARPGGSYQGFIHCLMQRGFTDFHIVEAYEPHWARIRVPFDGCRVAALRADIRDWAPEQKDQRFDAVFWHHGPEHVMRDDFRALLPHLQRIAKHVLYVGLPHGLWVQEDLRNNGYDAHVSHWLPDEIEALGFDVHAFGQPHCKTPMFGVWKRTSWVKERCLTLSSLVKTTSSNSVGSSKRKKRNSVNASKKPRKSGVRSNSSGSVPQPARSLRPWKVAGDISNGSVSNTQRKSTSGTGRSGTTKTGSRNSKRKTIGSAD